MGYRRRKYRRRSSGSSLYRKIAKTMRSVAYRRKTARLARYGARMKRALRRAGIKAGQSFAGEITATNLKVSNPYTSNRWFNKAWDRDIGLVQSVYPSANFAGRGAYSLGKAWRATVGKQAGRQVRNALVAKPEPLIPLIALATKALRI